MRQEWCGSTIIILHPEGNLVHAISETESARFYGALDEMRAKHRHVIIDLSLVPHINGIGLDALRAAAHQTQQKGRQIFLTGTAHLSNELFAQLKQSFTICTNKEEAMEQTKPHAASPE